MLPSRSKRFVSVDDGDLPRLRLAENWQLALIALIMGGLFVVIFPRQALVEKLYKQHELDELTLFYVENLHRTDPQNADLSILLARARQERMDVAGMEQLLQPVIRSGDAVQRDEARQLLLHRYEQAFLGAQGVERKQLRERLRALLLPMRKETLPAERLQTLAFLAFRLGEIDLGTAFFERAAQTGGKAAEVPLTRVLVEAAQQALGEGQHALAARYFLLARAHAVDIGQARTWFQQGIAALMAASLFPEAMQAARQEIGNLADDSQTLRYLTRAALAAGDPAQASAYARQLMFGASRTEGGA